MIIAPFEFLVDPVKPLQVLGTHYLLASATLVTICVGFAKKDHRVNSPSLITVGQDLCYALQSAFFLVFFILVTIFTLPRGPRHIIIYNGLLGVPGLKIFFL